MEGEETAGTKADDLDAMPSILVMEENGNRTYLEGEGILPAEPDDLEVMLSET